MNTNTKDEFVKLFISTSTGCQHQRKAFNRKLTMKTLKDQLELITGIERPNMKLRLLDSNKNRISGVSWDDASNLDQEAIQDGLSLVVTDISEGMTEDPDVVKYEMPREEYVKLKSSVHQYCKDNRLGIFDCNKEKALELRGLFCHRRCSVSIDGRLKLGRIRFIGKTKTSNNLVLIGIEFDSAVGNSDGSIDGEYYFNCTNNYGYFAGISDVWPENEDATEESINAHMVEEKPGDII